MIERTWVETIHRSIRIENKTSKKVQMRLTIIDNPAANINFIKSTPAASSQDATEYIFDVEMESDAIQTLKLTFQENKQEKLELPPRTCFQ
ncbi:hypothetical protein [Candidatus Uabimicrobium amorphum]|uniref:FixG C-terminal immunoglobulin-like domain-containing protein n=1 Tax=Uabimicrobium amorphum TaxID=2596890 RepID=A0A5S9IS08_UABAM|nr:hypothetical protein [Candidatus Uabimicrobium amorphum]BBM86657.1 hypothetical protein UABAM_05043 [Candidatus Uabimicrobium amorphum]